MPDPITASVLNAAGSVFGRLAFVRQIGIETTPLLRMFLIECEYNLALVACVRLDDVSMSQSDRAYMEIARRLETKALEAVLGSTDAGSKAFKALGGIEIIQQEEEADEPRLASVGVVTVPPSVGERLRRLYVNTSVVRVAAEIHLELPPHAASGLRNIQFRTRLRNLVASFRTVAESLRAELLGQAG
jgi:hypothetical protein